MFGKLDERFLFENEFFLGQSKNCSLQVSRKFFALFSEFIFCG